jgi:hypothetical protein
MDAGMPKKIEESKKMLEPTKENANLLKFFQMALENLSVPSTHSYLQT